MGTSLSGLTPATTFDGLLKTSDNEPLDGTLKAISTGDGTDTILQLSNSALSIGGNTSVSGGVNTSASNALTIQNSDGTQLLAVRNDGRLLLGTSSNIMYLDGPLLKTWQIDNTYLNANKVGIGVNASGNYPLFVKGSGATSATTSLLVQNSAGSDLLKVDDDGNIRLGSTVDNNVQLHFQKPKIGGGIIFGESNGAVYGRISLDRGTGEMRIGTTTTTYYPTFYSSGAEAMRIDTSRRVGIGETTPTARLHVKGSGNDNTTTSLLVQNSDGLDALKVTDDGIVTLGTTGQEGIINLNRSSNGANVGIVRGATQGFYLSNGSDTNQILLTNSAAQGISINNGTLSMNASLGIKGSGATSATTALLIQNSAGTDAFLVRDDKTSYLAGNLGVGRTVASARIHAMASNSNGTSKIFIGEALGGADRFAILDNGFTSIGHGAPTSRLHVKGSGNDATTTALLVQNSDGDDMLKVLDSKEIQLNTGITGSITTIDATTTNLKQGDLYFRASTGGYLGRFNPNGFQIGNGATGAAAKLQVKGSGATSATTALLVQNSAGTDMLKVNDAGDVITTKFKLSEVDNAIYPTSRGDLGSKFSTINHFKNAYLQGYIHITQGTTSDSFSTYNASAKLQVDSTTQGFLPPRMTTTERDAISTPASGLMVYNTTTNKAQCYNGTTWNDLF